MKKATISETKNNLSRLLDEVRRGETVVIMDRRLPVALLQPYRAGDAPGSEGVAALIAEGIVAPPRRELDVQAFLAMPRAHLSGGASLVRAVLDEREESP